jgi:urea transport system substrate-binding protein
MKRRMILKQLSIATVLAASGWMPQVFAAQDTIKVGVLRLLLGARVDAADA